MNPAIQNTSPVLMEGGTVCWHGLFAPAALDALERTCNALALERAGGARRWWSGRRGRNSVDRLPSAGL